MTKTIGIIGTGQLGRMLALHGMPLGFHFVFLNSLNNKGLMPNNNPVCNLGQVFAKEELSKFVEASDVITFESENTFVNLIKEINYLKPDIVLPKQNALEIAQNRFLEKTMFKSLGFKTPKFYLLEKPQDLKIIVRNLAKQPNIFKDYMLLKTVSSGYDGKGQVKVRNVDKLKKAWEELKFATAILEEKIDFKYESSIIAVKGSNNKYINQKIKFYPLGINTHNNGILTKTENFENHPLINKRIVSESQQIATTIINKLDYTGVLALEFFVDYDDNIIINELAPRVHNSGHWSQDNCKTSQFENHLRAIAGLNLSSTAMLVPFSGMINILGKMPKIKDISKMQGIKIHLYNKLPKQDRKLGHLNLTCANAKDFSNLVAKINNLLSKTSE